MAPARALARNLAAGLRLATLRDVDRGAFCCDASQVAMLVVVTVALTAASALLRADVPLASLRDAATDVVTILVCGTLFAGLLARPALRTEIPVVLLSLAPAGTLVAALLRAGWASAAEGPSARWLVVSAFYLAWVLLVHYRGIEITIGRGASRAVPVYVLYVAIGLVAASIVPSVPGEALSPGRVAETACDGAPCPHES